MSRIAPLFVVLMLAAPVRGHFVFAVPADDGKTLKVVFSETLEVDDRVGLGPVAGLKLTARSASGADTPLKLKAHDHHLTARLPAGRVIFGSLDYGVMARGGQSLMLKYHVKLQLGMEAAGPVGQPAELTAERTPAGLVFRAWLHGKPAARMDVTILTPTGDGEKATTGDDGRTRAFAAPGRYGAWARVVEESAGEYQGQKFAQVRHYPTIVMTYSPFPPLPEAVSSFGAAVSGSHVYVFGGHRAKVHAYDTQAVTGGFRRLALDGKSPWEELAPGMPLQGLALVSHDGKLYRLGGMAPRNPPGEPVDNRSTASCAIFDPGAKSWTEFAPFPHPRSSHDAAVVGKSIIVIGGWNMRGPDGNDWCNEALVLDLAAAKPAWQSVPQPFRRRALQTAAYRGKVYAVGGLTEDGTVSNNVAVFEPAARSWADGPDLPGDGPAGFNPAICVMDDRLFVSLGDGAVVRLSPDGREWETVGRVAPRIVHRMVPAGPGRLLLLGGAARGENLDWAEVVVIK